MFCLFFVVIGAPEGEAFSQGLAPHEVMDFRIYLSVNAFCYTLSKTKRPKVVFLLIDIL